MRTALAVACLVCVAAVAAVSCGRQGVETGAGGGGAGGGASANARAVAPDPASKAGRIEARQAQAPAEFQFKKTAGHPDGDSSGANPAHGFELQASDAAVMTVHGARGAEPWATKLRWAGLGRRNASSPMGAPAGEPQMEGNRLTFTHAADLRQWYVNGELGLEQGFDIDARPEGPAGEPFVLEIALEGDLVPVEQEDGTKIELVMPSGETAAWYGEVHAFDSAGQDLPVRMDVAGQSILLHVDDSAAVYPIVVDPLMWQQVQQLVQAGGSQYGFSMGLSQDGSRLIVGNSGAKNVDIWKQQASSWVLEGSLSPGSDCDGITSGVGFGFSVAIDQSIALVGDPYESATSDGGVCVYRFNNGAWSFSEGLSPCSVCSYFGSAVAISGGQVMIHDDQEVRTYSDSGGSLVAGGIIDTTNSSVNFQHALAMSGTTALVVDADVGTLTPYVSIFTYNGSSWSKQGADIYPPTPPSSLVFSVGVKGNLAIIGQPGLGGVTGRFTIYRRAGNTWAQEFTSQATLGEGSQFGYSVAISDTTAAIGAPAAGTVTMYTYAGGTWGQPAKIAMPGTQLGAAVEIGTNSIAVGANVGAGAVYIFKASNGNPCAAASECASGFCVDGVCCEAACGNGAADCKACSVALGSALDGKCDSVSNGSACSDGNGCTQTDTCQSGVCMGGNAVTCTALDQCHTAGTCSAGACTNPNKANGTACNDGNACTTADACQNGTCTGGSAAPNGTVCGAAGNLCSPQGTCQSGSCSAGNAVTCTALDQCHDPGTCAPATGVCSNPSKANGSACNDNNPCTQNDSCQNGACSGGVAVSNGTSCGAGTLCSPAGTCQNGACSAGSPVTCVALDQCHDAGTCNPATGTCTNPAKADGSGCNDSNPCTQTDTCQSGLCIGGNPKVCAAANACQDVGICNAATGLCINPNKPDNTPCSDGNACTQSDVCVAGACVAGSPIACPAPDQCHDPGACNAATGVCTNPPKGNNVLCNDGDACTQTDVCTGGVCTGTLPKSCPAAGPCGTSACNPQSGMCVTTPVANGTVCDDSNPCTQTDSCQNGACAGANPKTCAASDSCHDPGTCNPANGVCSNPSKANGATCDDGSVCTQNDTCQNGACAGGAAITCTPSPCHTATCDAALGCVETAAADGAACNDGNACTQTDKCTGGLCVGGNPKTCGAANQCQDPGVCDAATGMCVNPNKADGAPCNDGNACTQNDVCTAGACTAGPAVTCAASDQCHDPGTCSPATGMCTNPPKGNNILCDDGDACTQKDVCTNGVCVGSLPITCAPAGACGVAACDKMTGSCVTTPAADGAACDDGNPCTQTDSCQAGACKGASEIQCPAADACHTAGACNPMTGMCDNYLGDGAACDDGDKCTNGEKCQAGGCTGGTTMACPPSQEACAGDGVCDPMTGMCGYPPAENGTTCDDGDKCTQVDTCQAGKCAGALPIACDSPGPCEESGACDPMSGACAYTPKADGTACDDQDKCTPEDTCKSGVCAPGKPLTCDPPSDECHAEGVCNPGTGVCDYPLNGTPCEGPATVWNGGGCSCRQAGASSTSTPSGTEWLVLLLAAGLGRRRRRAA